MEKIKDVTLEEISKFVFASKYARYNDKLKRRETWEEAVQRVEDMHLKKYANLSSEDLEKIKWAFSLVKEKRVVPSMRSMQFGGKAVEAHNARLYNCAVRHVDSLRSFAEIFYLLLCGCGVGVGLSKFFLNRLPNLVNAKDKTGTVITYVVEDDIEGWADSVEALLMCYFKNTPYTGRKIVFDYSRIRPEGAPLKTGGGKAPGYKGLKECHKKIKQILDYSIEYHHQDRLKTVNAYDILMHCGDAVLSGGVRRTAMSVIFDKDDKEMINAKTYVNVDKVFSFHYSHDKTIGGKTEKIYEGRVLYEGQKYDVEVNEYELKNLQEKKQIWWKPIFPHRARSNNSVLLLRKDTSKEEFESIIEQTKQFGEPGFVWGNHPWQLFNPCFEIGFIPVTDDGICGVQFCNLTSQNGAKITNKKQWEECAEAATILGTLQAGYTNFPYLSKVSKELTESEALLGVSITGMMDNPDVLLNPALQKHISSLVIKINEIWSNKIGIKPAARTTCVKPEGTGSWVLGAAPGIHARHDKPKFIRRVQVNHLENVYRFFKKHNKHACEKSIWDSANKDDVVSFPIIVDDKCLSREDLTAIKHLEYIKSTQENWVINGTSPNNKKPVEHNVSCTITVKDDEWSNVIDYIYKNRYLFAAVSMLSFLGDKTYKQAPYESISSESEEQLFNNLIDNFKTVDYSNLKEEEDYTELSKESACSGGACEL